MRKVSVMWPASFFFPLSITFSFSLGNSIPTCELSGTCRKPAHHSDPLPRTWDLEKGYKSLKIETER
jgi:hypothetical protein